MKKKQYTKVVTKGSDTETGTFYFSDRKCTILHREDGPAIEYADGDKAWYLNGKMHRTDGPAVEYTSGTECWYIDGKRHRLDCPAIEDADGSTMWFQHGKMHRVGGPATELPCGYKAWWLNGDRHRVDGPAIEDPADGITAWFINGNELTETEFNECVNGVPRKLTMTELEAIVGYKFECE